MQLDITAISRHTLSKRKLSACSPSAMCSAGTGLAAKAFLFACGSSTTRSTNASRIRCALQTINGWIEGRGRKKERREGEEKKELNTFFHNFSVY